MVLPQMIKFGLVGFVATGVHMMIGLMLLHSGWQALSANALAFVIAFLVSFVGHFGYSFADQDVDFATSFWKFLITGSGGFVFNEALLSILMLAGSLTSWLALLVSTTCAAILTFIVSNCWAFKDKLG